MSSAPTTALTAKQMQRIETNAIKSGSVTGEYLMERAGEQVVEIINATASVLNSALILAGPGNNGGDGFVIARLLRDQGVACTVALLGDPMNLKGDAKTNYKRWLGSVVSLYDLRPCDVIVDALFGTGLKRDISSELIASLKTIQSWNKPIYAVDIPSGLCSDRGIVLGDALKATHTISFHSAKLGHYLADGPDYCGQLHIADIQLNSPKNEYVELVGRPRNLNKTSGHKYDYGHALIISGEQYKTGAARLAALSALRIGAGLTTIATPINAASEIAADCTSIMVNPFNEAKDLIHAIDEEPRWVAIAIGPNLGLNNIELVEGVLKSKRAVVLDADAITIIASNPHLKTLLHLKCILTPHCGEFARLVPMLSDKLKNNEISKVEACQKAAIELGCIVLIKGRDSIISDGLNSAIHCAAYDREAAWLATAGSGDCLAGIIAGLLARGLTPLEAAKSATWLHVEAARIFGAGLISEDIPAMLPRVLQNLVNEEGDGQENTTKSN